MKSEEMLKMLEKAELLPIQQKLVTKLVSNPFDITKKTSYEPLYDLLKTLFITEYPNFKMSKEIAHHFFENNVDNIQSSYSDFQSYALMFHSYFNDDVMKKEVYHKITKDANLIVLQKRIMRCREETLLKTQLDIYRKLNNSLKPNEIYNKGFTVIIAALQVLQYLPEDPKQIERVNHLAEEIVLRLKEILPQLKSI